MLTTHWAVVRDGKIELSESVELPEGAPLLVTLLDGDDTRFWQGVGERSLAEIWDNPADDVYAELLEE
jgi:hypothetical protein